MEYSSFFNSVNDDREYEAKDFAEYFKSVLTNGVFPSPSNNLQVNAVSGFQVKVLSGKAFIEGYQYYNDEDLLLNIDLPDGALHRLDLIVLQLNLDERKVSVKLKKGTPAINPIVPTLTRNDVVYELGLAQVRINANVTQILPSNITDLRPDSSKCGFVNSLISVDTTTMFQEYQHYLDETITEKEEFWDNWITSLQEQIANDDHTQINEKIDLLEIEAKNRLELLENQLDDSVTALDRHWSSEKTYNELVKKLEIGAGGFLGSAVEFSGGNLNVLNNTSYVRGNNLVNAPNNGFFVIHHIKYDDKTRYQMAFTFTGGTVETYTRGYTEISGWSSWNELHNTKTVQNGTELVTPIAGSTVSKRVNFAKPFKNAPSVTLTGQTSGPNVLSLAIGAPSTTGFDIYMYRTNAVDTAVHWQAIEKTQ